MRVQKAIKRIAALGAGVSMLGATIMGAMAADLSAYPGQFIKDGKFTGVIVVGDNAAASDVIGSINIATSLQFSSKTVAGTSTAQTTVTGDAVEISKSSNLLELGEDIGNVRDVVTSSDLDGLEVQKLTNAKGTTDINQFLRFNLSASNADSGAVIFTEDEDDEVGAFLFYQDSDDIFELELEFEDEWESDVDANSKMEDIEDDTIKIMGEDFTVIDTLMQSGQSLRLTMASGAVKAFMEEGEEKTFTINDVDYTIKVKSISDVAAPKVVLDINGETTKQLAEGGQDTTKEGLRIVIDELISQEAGELTGGDSVQFFLGANTVEFTDTNYADDAFVSNVKINDESIEDARVKIKATNDSGTTLTSGVLKISNIKYRLAADGKQGDVYAAKDQSIRELLDEPEGLFSPTFNIVYRGLKETATTTIEVDSSGNDEYNLKFTNNGNLFYNVDLVSNKNGIFRYGDDDQTLWFLEGGNLTQNLSADANDTALLGLFPIARRDWFVLTDQGNNALPDDGDFTNVMKYDSIDTTSNKITFTDVSGGTKEVVYSDTTGTCGIKLGDGAKGLMGGTFQAGDLIVSGNTYRIILNESDGANPNISVDLNGDGDCAGFDEVQVVTKGGAIIDLGTQNNTARTLNPDGHGAPADGDVRMELVTLSENMDGNPGNEKINITINTAASNEVDLDVPSNTTANFNMRSLPGNVDEKQGMNKYGLFVREVEQTNDPDDTIIEYPLQQRGPLVYVELGSTSVVASEEGEAFVVQKIEVGAAKLASEVSDVTAQNSIVVGGPCANTAAATLMGNPADCTEGFEEGKAMIKLYENANGNVALLVAGYSALDTRRASVVLANFADYKLTGKEASVAGTTLSDIKVTKVE